MRACLRSFMMVIAGACLMAAPAAAHRVHAGVTEVIISATTGELQISHRLYSDDLMLAVGTDAPEEEAWYASPEGVAAIGAYVAAHFRIGEGDGRLIEPAYIGAELDGELAWVYFTAPAPADTTAFTVDNDLLAETFEDQVMMTNFTIDSVVRTAMQGPARRDAVRIRFAPDASER